MVSKSTRKKLSPEGSQTKPSVKSEACVEHREKLLDEALEESFPASDPPSIARPSDGRC